MFHGHKHACLLYIESEWQLNTTTHDALRESPLTHSPLLGLECNVSALHLKDALFAICTRAGVLEFFIFHINKLFLILRSILKTHKHIQR